MKSQHKIFLVDDDELIITMLTRALEKEGYTVRAETHTDHIVNKIRAWSPDLLLLDVRLPDISGIDILKELMGAGAAIPVVMLTADDTAETSVKAMKLGAVDYLTKPFNMEEVKIVIRNIIESVKLKEEAGYLKKRFSEEIKTNFIGEDRTIKKLILEVEQVAKAGVSTILITGESGTGKELLARYIYNVMYQDGYPPFIRVNCSALPEALLETELFGYFKGAFTDAKKDKKGLFELSDGGCILLDEIGEMQAGLQSKLLRVLEERKIRRVGGKDEIPVAVTVIATTNQDLSRKVEEGSFRLDLFYRLNTFNLRIVPLRSRKEDIPLLAGHFLSFYSEKYNKKDLKGLSREADILLRAYPWPGNVRELKNVIERIVVLKCAEEILPEHLPFEIMNQSESSSKGFTDRFILPESGIVLDDVEKDLIEQALQKSQNNKTQAAKLLGISYDTLRYQIKKYGL